MYTAEDTRQDTNSGNDGFVWSGRATFVTGLMLAIALAAAKLAPVLASPLEWLPH